MLLLGILLMSASGAFIGLLIADNLSGGPGYQATVLGNDLVTLSSLGVFLAGVALGLIFCLGLALTGLARRSPRAVRPGAGTAVRREADPTRPAGRVEPVDEPVAPPAERAAEQGGRGGPAAGPARGGRIRHLFGQ
ncbi:hypothetical protein [Kitasatospora sp. NPDC001132]